MTCADRYLRGLENCNPLDKAHGVLSQPNVAKAVKRKERCLLESSTYDDKNECYKYSYLDDNGLKVNDKFWLLNRLDSATSGVILGACDEKTARIVKKLFKQREISKIYYARVFGKLIKTSAHWEHNMEVDKGHRIRATAARVSNPQSTKIARSIAEMVDYDKRTNTSLIQLKPLTGYSHQLRFQCAAQGHPIVGDKVYGDFDGNKAFQETMKLLPQSADRRYQRLMLHSHSMQFDYVDSDNKACSFSAVSPVPLELTLS